jgi:hypothetical protein
MLLTNNAAFIMSNKLHLIRNFMSLGHIYAVLIYMGYTHCSTEVHTQNVIVRVQKRKPCWNWTPPP